MTALRFKKRFYAKVRKTSKCWVWTASLDGHGYGQMWSPQQGRVVPATHIAWFIKHGKWPTKCVLHRCDNPLCIRPGHLFQGTKKQNTQDMVKKLRARGPAKLTTQQVLEIRRLHEPGVPPIALANRFAVSEGTIYNIVKRFTYAWVT